jgi:hypothetical protein
MRLSHAVNSNISNTYVGDCFVNGLEVAASEITFTNMTYGLCGAAGIELTPERYQYAGLNFSKNQTITFAGSISIDRSSLNNGATPYLQLFAQANDIGITTIVNGSLIYALGGNPLDPNPSMEDLQKMSNVITSISEPQMSIIALIFNGEEGNLSELKYSNELNDGIVSFRDIEVNDQHQYVELELLENLGRVLLFNLNYVQD